MSDSKSSSNGIGFVGLLTIVFIVLKLVGKITWSWWWVLSPLWIMTIVVVVMIVGAAFFAIRADAARTKREWEESQRPFRQ